MYAHIRTCKEIIDAGKQGNNLKKMIGTLGKLERILNLSPD